MPDRDRLFSSIVSELGAAGGAAWGLLRSRIRPGAPRVAMYGGFGAHDRLLVQGRALEDPELPPADAAEPAWRNAVALLQRADADPVPRAVVRVTCGASSREFIADDEGFFSGWMDARDVPRDAGTWVRVRGEIVSTAAQHSALRGEALAFLPQREPELLVVSDVDDTVLQSHMTRFASAVRAALFQNARTRLPFPGVAAFYRALRDGPSGNAANPLFYVSSSPWNLYDVITEFLQVQDIPPGPIMLRDVDLSAAMFSGQRHHVHKRECIRRVLGTYPAAAVVLIGDSGQQDPEIYRDVVAEFPERVRAIYIRNVTMSPDRTNAIERLAAEVHAAGSTLVLADDTLAAARHAASRGLIDPARLEGIGADKRADEGRTDEKSAQEGAPQTSPTTTTIVE